jgi:hypothetical protein
MGGDAVKGVALGAGVGRLVGHSLWVWSTSE